MLSRIKALADAGAPTKKRSPLKLFARLGVTGVLLYVVYGRADRIDLLKTFESFSVSSLLVLAAVYALGQMLSAVRWRTFIEAAGLHRPFNTILRAYFFGMLVNIVGIGTVGGDVARALSLRPKKGERGAALATVIADRAFGLITLITIGAIFLTIEQPSALGWFASPIVTVTGSALLIAGWFIGPRALVRFIPPSHRFHELAQRVAQAFPVRRAPLVRVTLISVIFHVSQILMHALMADVLGAPLSMWYLFATVPIINTAASLPLSIQGVGIRESLYLLFFTPQGVSPEACIAFGAIWIFTVTIVSGIGGFLLPPVIDDEAQSGPSSEVPSESDEQPLRKAEGMRAAR